MTEPNYLPVYSQDIPYGLSNLNTNANATPKPVSNRSNHLKPPSAIQSSKS